MVSPYLLAGSFLLAAFLFRLVIRQFRPSSIAHLSGPPPGSWLVGNYPDFLRPKNAGDAEFAWVRTFGTSMKIKGPFGSDVLFTADPKSLQWILNTSGYNYPRSPEIRALVGLITGRGLVWAHGEQHSRHRKIMEPSFSHSSLRGFLPRFQKTAQKTASKWRDLVIQGGNTSSIINVSTWLARTTLDALGAAAFDYDFGALEEGTNNELANAYNDLFADSFLNRTDYTLTIEEIVGHVPEWLVPCLQNLPNDQNTRLRNYMMVARRVAQSLVDPQLELLATGKEGDKDIMSNLVRSNFSEELKWKLSKEEVLAQMTTIMIAGHETTGSTIAWILYELSRHVECQHELREEIKATRTRATQRGDDELRIADLESMKFLGAIIKETLRFHPIVINIPRIAGRDDVIPLSMSHKTKTGELITSVPVSKGQRVIISLSAYNRLRSVWGEDADIWRPERFLEEIEGNQKTALGVVANLATFGSGVRSCIGWRFALIEMQAMVVELIENIEFSPPTGNVEILRAVAGLMSPMVKGSNGRAELPLTITPLN